MLFDYQNTSYEVRDGRPAIAILPIGATEQEGDHLPVGAATLILEAVSRKIAQELEEPVYLLPVMPFGTSGSYAGTVGTIALGWSTLMDVVTDIVESLAAQGIRRIVVVNSLGGAGESMTRPRENYIVKTAVRQLNYDHPELDVLWVQPFTAAAGELKEILTFPQDDVHAGELTTSVLMHLAPDLVQPLTADRVPSIGKAALDWVPFGSLCPDGVWGHPSAASAEKGRLAVAAAVKHTITYIQESFAYLAQAKGRS
jgi:creatinine amidohydrolase